MRIDKQRLDNRKIVQHLIYQDNISKLFQEINKSNNPSPMQQN